MKRKVYEKPAVVVVELRPGTAILFTPSDLQLQGQLPVLEEPIICEGWE